MRFSRQRRPDPLIDISPMIDVVFQLLLFFMVSTTFISNPGIEVDLPKAGSDNVLSEKKEIDVWVTADGAVYVDDESVDLATLRSRLRSTAERDATTLVIIKADAGVQHGRVVTVMDMARSLGLTRLAIATEDPNGAVTPAPEPEAALGG